MRQGTIQSPGAIGWRGWVGEGISLLMALILVGTLALIGGLDDWDTTSIGLMTFVFWVLFYFGIFQFLDRFTP